MRRSPPTMTDTQRLSPAPGVRAGSLTEQDASHGQHPSLHTPPWAGEVGQTKGSSPPGGSGLSQPRSPCRGTGQQGRQAKRVPHPEERIMDHPIISLTTGAGGGEELPLQLVSRTSVCPQASTTSQDSLNPALDSPGSTGCPAEDSTEQGSGH